MVTARGIAMRKASEYERNAEECLKLARCSQHPEYKKSLEQMAQTWVVLAEERRRRQQKQQDSH
jgi:hypothetical protein